MNSNFVKTMDSFRSFMTSDSAPNYVVRYCENLDEIKWIWFYAQMLEAVKITDHIDYLFYVLKWILKSDFHDIAYEMYFYDIMNPENRSESLIKDEYWEMYSEHYHPRLIEDIANIR